MNPAEGTRGYIALMAERQENIELAHKKNLCQLPNDKQESRP